MRVVFLTGSVSRRAGGLFNSVRRLAQTLADHHGVSVHVIGVSDEWTARDVAEWDGVRVTACSRIGPPGFALGRGMWKSLRDSNPDVVHVHGLWMFASVISLFWTRWAKKPHVVSPRGMLDEWALNASRDRKRVAAWLFEDSHLESASCIHALSVGEAEACRQYGLTNRICIIPNGVDLTPSLSATENVTLSLRSDNDERLVLYLGRLHPKKGLESLIQAWSTLSIKKGKGEYNNWRLIIAGWGPASYEGSLKKYATLVGANQSVRFVGALFGREKAAAFNSADVFILPSASEGVPMSVLEAWAHGLPVLMTSECNIPEGFAEGAAMRISQDPASIKSALDEILSMSDLERWAVGSRGRALVARHFSWSRIAALTVDLYRSVLGHCAPLADYAD